MIKDKNNTYIDETVKIDETAVIYPNVVIEGNSIIGANTIIGPGTYIKDSQIGDNVKIYNSQIFESTIGNYNHIGPFSNIRSNTKTSEECKIGAFSEVKNSTIGRKSSVPHLAYVGDSIIGENVNFGCGAITANYDGDKKHQTIIEDNAFIGCNSNLIAPVTIKENSIIAAGSTITDDVPANALGIARARQINKENYKDKLETI